MEPRAKAMRRLVELLAFLLLALAVAIPLADRFGLGEWRSALASLKPAVPAAFAAAVH
jgi:hypothetical protein